MSRSPGEQRGRRRRRQRLTESAPRPAPGVGAGDRRAGLGAGAREERLTVKSQAKAQKTQRQEHRLPSHASPGERTALLMWHTVSAFPNCPRPAMLATLSRASSLPKVLGSNRIRRTTPSPPFPTLSWYLKAPRVTGRCTSVRQLVRPACPCGSSILGR